MKTLEELMIRDENGIVIFFNPENYLWAKMRKEAYENMISNPEKKRELAGCLDKKYKIFDKKICTIEKSEIKSVYFAITKKCNMNCSFCSMNSGPDESTKDDLSLHEIANIVIPKIKKLNPKKIVVSGGEPLVRDDLNEILKVLSEAFGKERMVLQSNGLLMNLDILSKIKSYIGGIEFSIENIFANEKLLNRMEQIFEYVVSNELVLAFSFVIDKESQRYLLKAVDLSHKYNAIFTMRIVSPVGRAAETADSIFNYDSMFILNTYYNVAQHIVKHKYFDENLSSIFLGNMHPKRHCGAFGNVLAIHPNGTTMMCSNFKDEIFSMGNILDTSVEELIDRLNEKLQNEKLVKMFCVDVNPMCKECDIKYFCSGPCVAEVAENLSCLNEITERCSAKRILTKYSMFYYNKNESDETNLKEFLRYLESAGLSKASWKK